MLQHQIDNQSYAKYLLNQTNFDQTLTPEIKAQAVLAVKDHYTFDFLGLAEEHSERELELALVGNLRRFLAEMGGLFIFVGTQHRNRRTSGSLTGGIAQPGNHRQPLVGLG